MATIFTSCPACQKQFKIPTAIVGKKIKCKSCGNVFVAQSSAFKPEPPRPAGPETFKPVDDDDGDGKPYGVTDVDLTPRCPHCANEFEDEGQVICLHCGYNTETREIGRRIRTRDLTGMDWFWWLLPGILSALSFFICLAELVNVILGFFIGREAREKQIAETWGDMVKFGISCNNCCTLWLSIFCLACMYWSAKYAIKRLVFNFKPPEEELH